MKSFSSTKLLQLCKPERALLLWGLFFLIISSACLLIYPQSIKSIIDQALVEKDSQELRFAAFLAITIFFIQAVTGALRYYFFTLAGEKIVKNLRTRIYRKILFQDMTFFDQEKTGDLLSRLTADAGVLQNALSVNISMLLRSSAQALGSLLMLFITSRQLTLFIILIIPPIGFLASYFGRKIKTISKSTQQELGSATAVAEEGISGIRTVKAFAQEDFEIQRYGKVLDSYFSVTKSKITEVAKFTGLVSLLGLTAIVFVVWYGGNLVINGELSIGTLTSFLLYLMTLAFSVALLGGLWTDFMSAIGASTRIFNLLESDAHEKDSSASSPVINNALVEFNNVSFDYPSRKDTTVLKNINFSVRPYETVAFVGSSGSGKSTIVSLLLRFYDYNLGDIQIDNISLKNYALSEIRKNIGLVAQEPVLISDTVLENVRYGKLNATEFEIVNACKLANAHDFIMQFPKQYLTLVGQKGVQLSGGQKQRIAIARALIKNPKILILDEATSALDSESEYLVQQSIENLMGKRTTIIIAHRLSTIKKADKIIVLDRGEIIQIGTHQGLLNEENSFYRKLIEKQFSE